MRGRPQKKVRSLISIALVILTITSLTFSYFPKESTAAQIDFSALYPDTVFRNGSQTTQPVVALTFDDGPDPRYTSQILDVLKKYDAKGTFFVIGDKAKNDPDILQRMEEEGHVIANHTTSHIRISKTDSSEVLQEVVDTDDIIFNAVQKTPLFFRPPFGELTIETVTSLQAADKKIILWSIDTEDWKERPADDIVATVKKDIEPGAIILMHDGGELSQDLQNTVKALDQLLQDLSTDYDFVTVEELLNEKAYIENETA
ncbi:polysaccharide deacetylase family protein [Bacillaceae bacterium SIJ1]|uniref:polysaccharide deacetylase family protein n=1 Tax=Litoribacterium kuwaitense TaxID=1398745 RepID=UPI0013EA9BC5|nr:polysaccharide deacetylase family protein [Litoribacterium kuwaitense]NGP45799.1 polysaccharide deacetylase family protein [Litoribacterium kuwaitense]